MQRTPRAGLATMSPPIPSGYRALSAISQRYLHGLCILCASARTNLFPCRVKGANRAAMSETQTVYAAFTGYIVAALDALEAAGTLPAGLNPAAIAVEPPRDASHGDLATNAAMV